MKALPDNPWPSRSTSLPTPRITLLTKTALATEPPHTHSPSLSLTRIAATGKQQQILLLLIIKHLPQSPFVVCVCVCVLANVCISSLSVCVRVCLILVHWLSEIYDQNKLISPFIHKLQLFAKKKNTKQSQQIMPISNL